MNSGVCYGVTVSSKEGLERLRKLWRKTRCADAYDLNLEVERTCRSYEWISTSFAGLPIKEIEVLDYDGPVYELSVAAEGSFFAGTGGLLLGGG